MTARKSPKVQRWTDLLAALLRRNYPVPFETLAAEVPGYDATGKEPASVKRTFERDKKELLRFGVPLQTVPDDKGEPTWYTLDRASFYLPYLSLVAPGGRPSVPARPRPSSYFYRAVKTLAFEPDELAAVASAARRVRSLGDPVLAAEADSAMRKLAYDLPVNGVESAGAAPAVVAPRAQAGRALFASLGDALRDLKTVTFDYHAMGSDDVARRTADPYGLFYLNGHWYLAARDHDRSALRNFRLNRMANVEVNEKREGTPDYAVPADFSLREHARSRQAWELGDGDGVDAIVEFRRDTGAAASAARLGAPVPADASRRRFVVRRMDSFVRWLLTFGADVRPLSPAALVDAYDAQLRATLALYAGDADAEAVS